MKKLNAKDRRVLIIPDTHIPYEHCDALSFLEAVKKKYIQPNDLVIHLGDELDFNQISFHEKDPDVLFSPSSELKKSIEVIKQWNKVFPKLYLCESNHGSLVYRRQKHAGIPRDVIKPYAQVLGTKGWHWNEDYLIKTRLGEVYICHGKTSMSGTLSKTVGTYGSTQGHFHSKQEIVWNNSVKGPRFDAYAGCLINRHDMAFAYAKNHLPKPLLGCMLISQSGYPRLIVMELNSKNRWIKELP